MRKFVALAVLGGWLPAFGWGPEGHRLVVRIAEAQLSAAARARIAAILAPGESLASLASWADDVRRSRPATYNWHFIDIPIDQPRLDMARDCPKGDCILVKIGDFEKALGDPATAPAERREALLFLVHFVGDMHQPLHCSNNNDRGGNDTPVLLFGRMSNLHSAWDSGLLDRELKEDQLFPVLSRVSRQHAGRWSKGTINEWAEESHKASQKTVYGRLPKTAAGTPARIDAAYEKKADALIRQQIEKAGARLARVLNDILR